MNKSQSLYQGKETLWKIRGEVPEPESTQLHNWHCTSIAFSYKKNKEL